MSTLQFFLPDSSTTYFELPETEKLTLGASSENDLQIVDGSISRAHAELLRDGNNYRIKDLGSTNKTWVNDVAVVDVPLKEGSNLRLGHVEGRLVGKKSGGSLKSMPPLALLQITSGEQKGVTHRFRATHVTLGWKSQNIIRLADASVSGQHAEITCEKGSYRIKDLESSNHTFLNDIPITEAELKDGDSLRFGALEATFILPAQAPQVQPAPQAIAPTAKPEAEKLGKLEKENTDLRKEIETLKTELKSKESDEERLKKQEALEAARKEIETLKAELSSKESDEERLKKQEAFEAARKEIETLKAELSSKESDEERLKKQEALEAARKEIETLKTELKSKESDEERLKKQEALEAARKEIETLKAELSSKESDEERLKKQEALDAARKEIETLKAELSSKESDEERLKKEEALDAAKKEIETLKAELSCKESNEERLNKEKALDAALKEIEALSKQREAAETEAAALAAKLDDERQQSESIAVTNTQFQLDLDLAASRIKDLEKRLGAVTEERDAAQQSVVELEHQYAALQAEQSATSGAPLTHAAGKEGKAGGKTAVKPTAPPPALKKSRSSASATVKLESSPASLREMIDEAPHAFSAMRKLLQTFIRNQRETTLLDQLLSSLHGLSTQADKAQLKGAVTMTRALEALINELITTPSQITSSSLRSISQSLDFLSTLFEEKNITRLQNPLNASIFAVDDDPDARKVIRAAMEVIQLKVTCAEDPAATLAILDEQVFDLIFVDVGLPDMNGFELCTKIRALPQHRKTPVVFLTGAVTVQNRVQSSLSGGNDFIAKPFNLLELGVKALTWILKGQLGLP